MPKALVDDRVKGAAPKLNIIGGLGRCCCNDDDENYVAGRSNNEDDDDNKPIPFWCRGEEGDNVEQSAKLDTTNTAINNKKTV